LLHSIQLTNFKSFRDAQANFGGLTTFIGTNASGKSNIRDALRFLHGVSRGYSIADIFGGKWSDQVQQWAGIRGGTREATFNGSKSFKLSADISVDDTDTIASYTIEIDPGQGGSPPRVIRESLYRGGEMFFDSHAPGEQIWADKDHILIHIQRGGAWRRARNDNFLSSRPVITQIVNKLPENKNDNVGILLTILGQHVLETLLSIQFLDLSVEKMRMPSIPGQDVLGDNGENLSSVLQAICQDEHSKEDLARWVKELTPMDAVGFDFLSDQTGRILLTLIESNGRRTSAYSASDGTLRFLAILAALLGPSPNRIYFVEELDNGIHPARIHLLLNLIEQSVSTKRIQVITTTHSPEFVGLLSDESRRHASVAYRLDSRPDSLITPMLDIPNSPDSIKRYDASRLMSTGWFEKTLSLFDDNESES
jgi:predicted ATPase